MSADLNVGTLVGYLTIDDSGVDKGLASGKAKITRFGSDGAAAAKNAGSQVGGAAGQALTSSFGSETAKLPGKTKGSFDATGVQAKAAADKIGTAFSGVGAAGEQSSSKLKDSFRDAGNDIKTSLDPKQLIGPLVAAMAGQKIVSFFKDSVAAASDLQQNMGAVQGVFKDASQTILDWSKTSATAVGVSGQEYDRLAALFGSQLKNMGVSIDQLAPKTNQLITLGADLSAMYGGTAADAIESISALLRGETDPIEKYGVSINQAKIDAYELANGLDTSTAAAKTQSDTTARLALLYQQTADAQGQFADQTDTLAEQQQIANAKFEDAKAAVGTKLLPVVTDFTEFLSTAVIPAVGALGDGIATTVGWIVQLPGPIKAAGVALAALKIAQAVGLLDKLSGGLAAARSGLGGFRQTMQAAAQDAQLAGVSTTTARVKALGTEAVAAGKAAGSGLFSLMGGPWGVALAGATLGVGYLSDKIKDWKPPVVDVTAAIDSNTGALVENAQAIISQQLAQNGSLALAAKMGVQAGDLTLAIEGNKDAYDRVARSVIDWEKAQGGSYGAVMDGTRLLATLSQSTQALADEQHKGAQAAAEQAGAQQQAAAAASPYADAQDKAKASAVGAAKAFDTYAFSTTQLGTAQDDARASAVKTAQAFDALGQVTSVGQMAQTTGLKLQGYAQAAADANTQSHDLSGALSVLESRLAELSGRTPTVEQAQVAYNKALQAAKDAVTGADGKVKMYAATLVDSKGKIDTTTKAGQDLYDTVTDNAKAAQDLALAQAQVAGKTGGTAAAADAAATSLAKSRQAFLDNHDAIGITRGEAQKLIDTYFGIPSSISTVVTGITNFHDVDNKLQQLADNTVYVNVRGRYVATDGGPGGIIAGPQAFKAAGGWIGGSGGPTADDQLIAASTGEFVVAAHRARMYGPLLEAINGGPGTAGVAKAVGGYVAPKASALAGVAAPDFGPVKNTFLDAYHTYAAAVSATRDAYTAAAAKATDLTKAYQSQVLLAADTAKRQRENIAAAKLAQSESAKDQAGKVAAAKASQAEVAKDQAARVAAAKRDADERVSDAQARVSAAKTAAARKSAQAAVAKAQRESAESVQRAVDAQTKANTAATTRVTKAVAAQAAASDKAAAKVTAATVAQQKATQAENAKTAAAAKAADAAKKAALVEKERYAATADVVAKSAALIHAQSGLAASMDRVNSAIDVAKDKLQTLQDASAQLASSVAGAVAGEGLTGMAGSSYTDILTGLKRGLSQEQKFTDNLAVLKARGLNTGDLQAISQLGVQGGSGLAAELAKASTAQLKEINTLESRRLTIGDQAGAIVASSAYAAQIADEKKILAALQTSKADTQKLMNQIATALDKGLDKGLKGVSVKVLLGNQDITHLVDKAISRNATAVARA